MIKFRVYFVHIECQVVEASSSDEARREATRIAKANDTFVAKVKRIRS